MKYHIYIFDDKTHDNYFVQHCLLLQSGFKPKQHFIQSNGCSSQFKSKIFFFLVNCYPNLTSGCVYIQNFFGSSRGKGLHDGAGAVFKRFIRHVQFKQKGLSFKTQEMWYICCKIISIHNHKCLIQGHKGQSHGPSSM